MNDGHYQSERVKLQRFQAKLQFAQVLIQSITLFATLLLLAQKL
jgi:hypothetical protein